MPETTFQSNDAQVLAKQLPDADTAGIYDEIANARLQENNFSRKTNLPISENASLVARGALPDLEVNYDNAPSVSLTVKRNSWTSAGNYAVQEQNGLGVVRVRTRDGSQGGNEVNFKDSEILNSNTDGDVEFKDKSGKRILERSDGSRVEKDEKGRVTGITYTDGSRRDFMYVADRTQPSMIQERNGNRWFLRNDGSYEERDGHTPTGKFRDGKPYVEPDGVYTVTDSNGDKETYYTDGTRMKKSPDGSLEVTDKNGQAHKIRSVDGKSYLIAPDGRPMKEVEVDDAGNYRELNSNSPNGGKWHKRDGSTVTLDDNGRVTSVDAPARRGIQRSFVYAADGQITAFQDKSGSTWLRDTNGSFVEYDQSGERTGQATAANTSVEVDALGNQIWITGDRSRKVEWTDGRTTEDVLQE